MPDTSSNAALPALPPLTDHAERLIALGVPELAGIPADEIRAYARSATTGDGTGTGGTLLAVHPDRAPPPPSPRCSAAATSPASSS